MTRKICVVTGSRAEYGLLYWLMKEIQADADLQLQVVATGMHLSPEFGLTFRQIEADGFMLDAKVEMLLSSDTRVGITKSVGLGVIGFADTFEQLKPDIVVVLGDRFEILAVAQAAFFAGIPLAHISGGEITEGALDDVIRHAITKMARYHFVAAEPYRKRVIQLGEMPGAVFNVGDPGLDNIVRLSLLPRAELSNLLGFDLSAPYLLVTYHPVTAGETDSLAGMRALLDALDRFPALRIVFTKPNADAGGRELGGMVDDYAVEHPGRALSATSLGQLVYLSAMRHCLAVVGNSSSGIVEAPALGRPTVNIGGRQHGRLKASSIIDCSEDADSIEAAIRHAISDDFQGVASHTMSLYGNCAASTQIRETLKQVELTRHFAKPFHDLS